MEPDAAPTARELDAALAALLGFKPIIRDDGTVCVGFERDDCPRYSTDPSDSAALRDELLRREAEWSMFRRPGWCRVYLALPGVEVAETEAASEEEAIARAALLALGAG